jgi:hypothetical protein
LFDAAEKAGAKVVVYEPQSPEIVDLVVNIFTKINRPGRKWHAPTNAPHKTAQDLDPVSRREAGRSRNQEPVKKK